LAGRAEPMPPKPTGSMQSLGKFFKVVLSVCVIFTHDKSYNELINAKNELEQQPAWLNP
jgi:hypothetical protein